MSENTDELSHILPAIVNGGTTESLDDSDIPVKVAVDEPIESNLVKHARRELELLGEEQVTVDGYLKIIQAFADMGHSGGSAAVATSVLLELLRYNNLTPLTDDPKDWVEVGSDIWQCGRNSEAFSMDGGATYYLISERVASLTPANLSTTPFHKSEPHTPLDAA